MDPLRACHHGLGPLALRAQRLQHHIELECQLQAPFRMLTFLALFRGKDTPNRPSLVVPGVPL